jgi:hypothetical protein
MRNHRDALYTGYAFFVLPFAGFALHWLAWRFGH